MMQEIYVIKVKTKPEVSKLYPSERRYSATTVAGLGLVHLLLGATILLLATLGLAGEEGAAARYGGGVALGVSAVATAGVAFLAWRRWYIDDNIRHFLIVSVLGFLTSLLCLIMTTIALVKVQHNLTSPLHVANQETHIFNESSINNDSYNATDLPLDTADVTDAMEVDNATQSEENEGPIGDPTASTYRQANDYDYTSRTYHQANEIRNVLLINILVACVLELLWCLLSARIAWKGVNNDYSDDKRVDDVDIRDLPKFAKRVNKPDIISHHVNKDSEYLPQDESTVEYEERVRRFLASNNDKLCVE